MATNKTVNLNGREYDARTGLPVQSARPQAATTRSTPKATDNVAKPITRPKEAPTTRAPRSADAVHNQAPKRSQTLRRPTSAKKPAPAAAKVIHKPKPNPARHMDIAPSSRVTKFAAHPQAAVAKPAAKPAPAKSAPADIPAQAHPVAQRAASRAKAKKPVASKLTAKQVKDAQIQKELNTKTAKVSKKAAKVTKKSVAKQAPAPLWKKRTIILTVIAVVALLAVIAATQVFPGLSVKIASIQSGVSASYPKYIPDGFSLAQQAKYQDGAISIRFKSNSNSTGYTLNQSTSSWDSTAVLDNIVKKDSDTYVTTRERGLTIYTYQTKAAWVNGGTLYTITGDADLSGDQIRKIATSL